MSTNGKRRFAPTSIRIATCLLPLALASIAAPSYAQSSVTMFGYLNVGVTYGNMPFDGGTALREESISRSNWGIAGKEDIGGGYFTTFKLSSRIDIPAGSLENMGDSNPNSRLFNGESTVGILAPWGQVRFGRAETALQTNDAQVDPWGGYDSIASPAWYMVLPGPNALGTFYSDTPNGNFTGRIDNAVFYDSPTVNGLTIHANAQVGQDAGDHTRNLSFMANYDKSWGGAGLGAERNSTGDKTYFAAAYVKIGTGQIGASYGNSAYKDQTIGGHTQSAEIAGSYTIAGVNVVKVAVGRYFNAQANFLGLSYEYDLSKRTDIYLDLGYYKLGVPDFTGNTKYSKVGLGIAHAF